MIGLVPAIHAEVEGADAGAIRGTRQRLGMAQGTDRVVVAGPPMVLHAHAGELVILGLPLVVLRTVDELDDLKDLAIRDRPQELSILAVERRRRELVEQIRQRSTYALHGLELIGVGAGAAGKLDLLLPRRHVGQVVGRLAARA